MDTVSTEWDTGDLDALEELKLKRDRGYELVRARIDKMIEWTRNDLEREGDYPKTCYLRGYVKALRDALDLPVILRTEITGLISQKAKR
jgi:hypothetical protein